MGGVQLFAGDSSLSLPRLSVGKTDLVVVTVQGFPPNSNSFYLLSIIDTQHIVHTDNHSTVPTSYICREDSSSEAAERYINEIAEVMQFVTSPPCSDRSPVLGARVWEPKHEGGTCHRAFSVVSSPPYAPNII